jgi:hypothetical protein
MNRFFGLILFAILLTVSEAPAGNYKNFTVAIYSPINATIAMKDPQWLADHWARLTSQVKIDKIYIETYRSRQFADESTLEPIKKFFTDKGIQVAGGMALDAGSINGQFQSPCYTDSKDRQMIKDATELTARHFDEIILDDFFFNTTKYDSDIAAKGDKTWTQFRLELMDSVAKDLVIGPAKAINPKIKMVIKFPNWYEHFAGLGYDLEQEPKLFDGIYTGTETRDPVFTEQHLQAYESYSIMRYFENIKPNGNGGGWVDPFDFHSVDRYAEQLWDTAFGKAREITLFNLLSLERPLNVGERSAWETQHPSFDYEQMRKPLGETDPDISRAAGYALEQADAIVGQLGNPIGIKSYRPYHATGEDFLHNYLGMIGIPIELEPTFPTDADMLILTESAKLDPDIVNKIKGQLTAGKSVVITSGLLRALKGKGIEDICEWECTDAKVTVTEFQGPGGHPIGQIKLDPGILIPQVHFLTNDAWMLVAGIANTTGYPLLANDRYSKGLLYVLTIPDNFTDLYRLPPQTLTFLKRYILRDFPIILDAPSQVSLFAYDNNTFIAESYLPTVSDVTISILGPATKLRDLVTGQEFTATPRDISPTTASARFRQPGPPRTTFSLKLNPHSYQAFAIEK